MIKFCKLLIVREHPRSQSTDLKTINRDGLSSSCLKDIEYFEANLQRAKSSNQVFNYTWEKSTEESPTFFKRHPVDDRQEDDRYKQTLELMAPYKGFPHASNQNKWEAETGEPPELKSEPQVRRTAVLSTMTK